MIFINGSVTTIDMEMDRIDIDPYMMMVGWSSGGERKRFVIGFKTMQFLGFTRFGYICIEA